YDVVVIGGMNTDYLVKGERLPCGETLEGEVFQESSGGRGGNQAVAVSRLGCRAALIGRIGADDRGTRLLDHVSAEGVDVTYVRRDANADTGAALIMVNRSGDKQSLWAPGANHRLTEADVEAAKGAIAGSKVLLAQLEVPVPAVALALRLAKAAGLRTVLDPAPALPLTEDVLRLVDVLRPNASEAATLTGFPVQDRTGAARAARALLDRGSGAVVVQAGKSGNLLVTSSEERFLPRIPVESVDSTGAGDAFAAGLAVGLAEGRPLAEAAAMGSAAAALATTKLGAQPAMPRREEVLRLVASMS
ncbi:MAG: ribokinase, partial [Gemmatimonadales bacterium]|nr:ribokinase [Gemmatimonadales bacterium]